MEKKKRMRFGFIGSVTFHLVLFGMLSIVGLAQSRNTLDNVTEITYFNGNGNIGGAGSIEGDGVSDNEIEESENENIQEQVEDGISDNKSIDKKYLQSNKKSSAVSNNTSSTGAGNGSGKNKSGSGVGNGAGTGNGTGSGTGTGNGIEAHPAVAPRLIHSVSPQYPETEKLMNIQGTVYIKLLIDTSGNVEDVSVANSSGNVSLDKSAVRACAKWKFSPAKNAVGQKVRCYWYLPIKFNLKG